MKISVIIITKNQKNILQKSLPVLLDQNLKGEYEVIVVDSGSTDGAVQYVKSLPVQLVKIKPKTFNFAKAFNIGAQKAKGKYSVKPTFLMGVNMFGYQFGNDITREKVFNFAGGCCAIRKKTWRKRPFNENLFEGEDAEYSWFLHLIGYNIVCNPKAKTIHEHKLNKSKDKSFLASRGVSKWQWIFNWQIIKYWLQRLIFVDPFKKQF